MDVVDSLVWSHQALSALNVPHALIGGLALSEYEYGRATQDVDWLVPEDSVKTIRDYFLKNGFSVFFESPDVLQFSGKAEIDFLVARRPISQSMLKDAHYSEKLKLPVVKPEDLIGLKIQAYSNDSTRRHKELADIQELFLRCSGLDVAKIKFYADHFNEWPTIEALSGVKK